MNLAGNFITWTSVLKQTITSFLIDELVEKQDILIECWEDDEFATKENLIETLTNKAKKQVAIANKRKQEEYDFWYRAYCD